MSDLFTSRGANEFSALSPDVAAEYLARAVARTTMFAAWRAPARWGAWLVLLVAIAAMPWAPEAAIPAAVALLAACVIVDLAAADTERARPFLEPLRTLVAALGPLDAAALAGETMGQARRDTLRAHMRPTVGYWLSTLTVQVRRASSAPCTSGHHPGCVHRQRPVTDAAGVSISLVEALDRLPV